MARQKTDVLRGTLALLVLKVLASRGALHGYALTALIQQASSNLLRVEEGSLYPALHRMEQEGWIRGRWGKTDTNREARFYGITAAGKRQLATEEQQWEQLTDGVARVLRFA
jgi:transcriptional regulator